jgi:hypothetical protein
MSLFPLPDEIYFKGFDSLELVSVPKAQLAQFLPVLHRQISTDPPRKVQEMFYWNVPCTRDTLIAVFKSINAGEIMMHDSASEDDVLAELSRQGAEIVQRFPSVLENDRLSGRKRRERNSTATTKTEGCGDGHAPVKPETTTTALYRPNTHVILSASDIRILRPTESKRTDQQRRLRTACEHIVNSVLRWARLIHAQRPEDGHAQGSFSCTSSRVWIQFLDKPKSMVETRKASVGTEYLCSKWDEHRWLRDMAISLMALRLEATDELNTEGIVDDQSIFNRTAQLIYKNICGPYWATVYDSGYRSSEDSALMRLGFVSRKKQREAARMAIELKCECTEQEGDHSTRSPSELSYQYMKLIRKEAMSCISPAALFTSDILDAENKSLERTALEEAFLRHNMRVVMWSDGPNEMRRDGKRDGAVPVLFPPAWHVNSLHTVVDGCDVSNNPAILLAYGE